MTMNETISKINEMRKEWYQPPTTYYGMTKPEFNYESYRHSAIIEIIDILINYKHINPITLVEEFRDMMDDFACNAKTVSANFMFSVYYDVATDILDVLIGTP